MEFKYTFVGVVLPERAQLSYNFNLKMGLSGGGEGSFRCSIVNNQVLAIMTLSEEVDIFTLRNIAHYNIQSNLSLLRYYSGIFYDVKIDRIYNEDLTVDYVYGVANEDIQRFWGNIDISEMIYQFRPKTTGTAGVLFNRALNGLMNALRSADDAVFFCYRAIESLRNHNSVLYSITNKKDLHHWESFKSNSGCTRQEIDEVKRYADDLRHGKPVAITADEVKHILFTTWGIVRKYLGSL
ncbi:hypothetical protein [Pantoea vagans]|jgi:hypothetical protein|uniref:hypothetical protein n=1 Tax=Pantoea vagans TaxID=470934 RepID=UPI0028A2083D|nr:hypothetical protein [Pantoea vagans]